MNENLQDNEERTRYISLRVPLSVWKRLHARKIETSESLQKYIMDLVLEDLRQWAQSSKR